MIQTKKKPSKNSPLKVRVNGPGPSTCRYLAKVAVGSSVSGGQVIVVAAGFLVERGHVAFI
jgi:hypothetical protein